MLSWLMGALCTTLAVLGIRRGWVSAGVLLVVAAFWLAQVLYSWQLYRVEGELKPFLNQNVIVEGTVKTAPEPVGGRERAVLAPQRVILSGRATRVRTLVRVEAPSPPPGGDLPLPWRFGDSIRVEGRLVLPEGPRNPGEWDERAYLRRRGIGYLVIMADRDDWRLVSPRRRPSPAALASSLRERSERLLENEFPSREGRLMAGLLLGDKRQLPQDMKDAFRRSGLSHVLAVSGLHVGLLAGALLTFLRLLPLGPRGRAAVIIPVLGLYALLTGASPPVLRAALMVSALMIARAAGRPATGLHFLCLAFVLLLAYNPFLLEDPGFQLSFSATLGIAILAPAWEGLLAAGAGSLRLPGLICAGLAVTVAAQVFTLPLVLVHFQGVSAMSLFANLLAVPLVGLVVPLGFIALAAGLIWPPLAAFVGRFVVLVLAFLDDLVGWLASWPWAYAELVRPPLWGVTAYYIGLFWLCLPVLRKAAARRGYRYATPSQGVRSGQPLRPIMLLRGLVIVVMAMVMLMPPSLPLARHLEVVFLDVGQGDAAVLHLPNGRTMAIDGGPPPRNGRSRSPLADYLRYRGIRRLDVLVLTHSDADHAGALAPVIKDFRPREVWYGLDAADPVLGELLAAAAAAGGRLVPMAWGDVARPAPAVHLEVFNPGRTPLQGTGADKNNNSVVLRLTYGRIRALFTADIESSAEEILVDSSRPLRAEVLKVGHHGSRSSTTEGFLAAVAPAVAVVSVGRNSYGHPHPDVLSRFESIGAAVWRTDREGAVIVRTDGRRLWVDGTRR